VATSQASVVRRMTRWKRPYTTDPQVSGNAVNDHGGGPGDTDQQAHGSPVCGGRRP
jgi:hypothetical protein